MFNEKNSPLLIQKGVEKPVVIAVVDTGFDFQSDWKEIKMLEKPKLCRFGHKDFTGTGLQDTHGHGTHVAGLIAQQLKDINYCLVIIKVFDPKADNLLNNRRGFMWAIDLKVQAINYSGGGEDYDVIECTIVKRVLDQGILFVSAAGNESSEINERPYYPAMCDTRSIAVQSVEMDGSVSNFSNFSDLSKPNARILYSEHGHNALSIMPGNIVGFMSGTSQATAIVTGQKVREMVKQGSWKTQEYKVRKRKSLNS